MVRSASEYDRAADGIGDWCHGDLIAPPAQAIDHPAE